ncbi:hypothetical protein [Dactylosporangium matsuzakiense]|uniref:Uncharacterized protein n=1 Tax=Dactylosporangium matsuzakiense TaxID=53360 RepID=A0A9W6KWD7_9ACTN|nr:hypothetical protein [Dactylosporangium matsuzakiense]GLL08538.1 hypothetical protein GCM10017581_103050 [Dactylosporangium matsuzakiense]
MASVAECRPGRPARIRDMIRRYQHTTGRTVTAGSALAALIAS